MIPQEVEQWRPIAEQNEYCTCGHIIVAHVAGKCGVAGCPCESFTLFFRANETLAEVTSESSGRPLAFNPADPSWGLMGITALIARVYGGFAVADDSWHTDPAKNIKCGAAFAADLKHKYAQNHPLQLPDGSLNPLGWIAAYNEGEPNLWKRVPDLPYVTAFVEHLAALDAATAPSSESAVEEGELDT